MKFENTEVWGFKHAIRGMRNPMNSWDKSDSHYETIEDFILTAPTLKAESIMPRYIIGKNDMELMQKLIRAGAEHRKFMRQIFVSVDITAPLYWWKEFDTYKVGTVANSTSTMHKIATTPITLNCFEVDDFSDFEVREIDNQEISTFSRASITPIIFTLESLRKKYLDTKDKKYWKELIRWLPESWLQTRTVTMNYENLLAMCSKGQRRFHKLNEWSGIDDFNQTNFISWARSLPYAKELLFIDELEMK